MKCKLYQQSGEVHRSRNSVKVLIPKKNVLTITNKENCFITLIHSQSKTKTFHTFLWFNLTCIWQIMFSPFCCLLVNLEKKKKTLSSTFDAIFSQFVFAFSNVLNYFFYTFSVLISTSHIFWYKTKIENGSISPEVKTRVKSHLYCPKWFTQ